MNDDVPHSAGPSRAAPGAGDDTVLDWARDAGAADSLAGGLDRYLRRRRRFRVLLASTACTLLLGAGVTWSALRETSPASPIPAEIAGATILRPEQRVLPDGSLVDLNAGAEIEVLFAASLRRIVLRKGEAHFQVTKDAQRPFVVTAGAVEVRAVGTAFAVELGAGAVDVLVTEGRVAVASGASADDGPRTSSAEPPAPPPLASLEVGGRVVVESQPATKGPAALRVSELSPADMQARLAWRVPRLKFAATPLPQVVAMFNEHAAASRSPRLVLAPSVPADLRVSGMLRADDIDSLLRLLAGEFGIAAEMRPDEIVLRRR